ncbi:MAG: alpha/beta hydrolase-fold protein [Bacteroidales bacterium]|nr:alpha/beta hydrolase-fold protein [Bacteroidales bacterium]
MKYGFFKKRRRLMISVFMIIPLQVLFGQTAGYPYKTFTEFRSDLNRISEIKDHSERDLQVNELWKNLKSDNQIPYRIAESVAFLYRGEAKTVHWSGDFNGWDQDQPEYEGKRAGLSDIWIMIKQFPEDARLDYKIVVDGKWITDPDNPYLQMSGMGPNSVLRMPGWKFPDETELAPDVIRGTLTDNILIESENLGYPVNYKVYTPYNYLRCENLPVIYVTDGQEYADDKKGALVTILDNLIFSEEIRPVIAVFIDPRVPGKEAENRRNSEYSGNQKYADFVGGELVPLIDKTYKTHACPDDRAILGASLGGVNAVWFGAVRMNDFHLLGIQSLSENQSVVDRFSRLDWFPFRICLTTGVYSDTQKQTIELKSVLERNKVDFIYKEVNEGHSWGNWKAQLSNMLRYFFPN